MNIATYITRWHKACVKLGHTVTVVSNGDFWKKLPRDINVSRRSGKLGGMLLMAKIYALLPRLRGYDIVQFINPVFFELKAERLFPLFQYLKKHNKKGCALWLWDGLLLGKHMLNNDATALQRLQYR